MKITPHIIEILLHYHWSKYNIEGLEAPATFEACYELAKHGMLIQTETGFKGNPEAIQAYIDAIKEVPLPIRKWVVEKIEP